MRIRKIVFFVFLLFTASNYFAQEDTTGFFLQSEMVHETFDEVEELDDLILFDNLLKDSLITFPEVRAMVHMARAEKHWDFIYDELILRSEEFIEEDEVVEEAETEELNYTYHLQMILSDYDQAIEMCKECAIEYQFKRYSFLREAYYNTDELELTIEQDLIARYSTDSAEMRSMGYREDRIGLGLGLNAIHGNDDWIGGELSVVSFLEPMNRLKYKSIEDGTVKRYWINIFPVEASWFTLGYNYNLSNDYHDFYFDLMNISSPVHFTFMKFGALKTNYSSKLLWYYRPEIGIGFGNISFYYAYNAIFKKSMRELSERHMIGLRIKLIPFKYN